MVVRRRFGMRLLVCSLGLGSVLGLTGCPGGCFEEADPVRTSPATSCLKVEVGTICGDAELEGTNTCAEALVLPPTEPGGEEQRFEAGGSVRYTLHRSSPGIRIFQGKNNTDWTISAKVGDQDVAIIVTIHEID